MLEVRTSFYLPCVCLFLKKNKKDLVQTIHNRSIKVRALASGVPNAKFLAFDTPNTKTLTYEMCPMLEEMA